MEFDTARISKEDLTKALDQADKQHAGESRSTSWSGQVLKVEWSPKQKTEQKLMSTIGDQLKAARAQLADVRQAAANAVAESADAARVVLEEIEKARKEAADLRAEVATLTNGGPS